MNARAGKRVRLCPAEGQNLHLHGEADVRDVDPHRTAEARMRARAAVGCMVPGLLAWEVHCCLRSSAKIVCSSEAL